MWQLPRRLFWFGMWLFGLAMLLWYLLRWWPGDQLIAVRLLNYFMPWLLLILMPALLLTALARRMRLLAVLLIPAIGIGLIIGPQFRPKPAPVQADSPTFKVMSYNVLYSNVDYEGMGRVIQQEQPDIVMLQEIIPAMQPYMEAYLSRIFPDSGGYMAFEPALGQAILSRYPIREEGATYHLGRAQQVTVLVSGQPIAVWNVHPRTAVAQENWQLQQIHMQALGLAVAAHQGPLIVAGDFNTTSQSDNYWQVGQHLADTHIDAEYGLGFTFPAEGAQLRNPLIDYQWQWLKNWYLRKLLKALDIPRQPLGLEYRTLQLTPGPVVRIDHMFYSDHFSLLESRTLKDSGGSDHLPIVAEFTLPQ